MMTRLRKAFGKDMTALRLGIVCGVPLALGIAFLGASGILTPARLTPGAIIADFRAVDGAHPGFRRNHAKGVCVTGWFDGNGNAGAVSHALVFGHVHSRVVGRFALAGGMPYQEDGPAKVRSMALRIMTPRGGEWRMGINDIPVFPVQSATQFSGMLQASRPDPLTHKPDPARLGAFLAAHPASGRAIGLIKARKITSGFADDTFNSLDSFVFTNADGQTKTVRWAMIPELPPQARQAEALAHNYLFDDLISMLARGPLRWHLVITIAGPDDQTADPTLPWPVDRTQIDAGTLTLDTVQSEDGGPCTDITYDPLILPPGIEPSDDPLPAARSAVYSRSYTQRSGEVKPPSAVTVAEIHAGDR